MRFTVVTPFHDAASTLDACVASIVEAMAGHDAQLVLADDGSRDDGPAIAAAWAARDARIDVVTNARNRGPGIARNRAIAAARGDWLLFVDADDHLHDDALDHLAAAAAARPDADLLLHSDAPDGVLGSTATVLSSGAGTRPVDLPRLRERYLLLRTDGGVCRTAVRRVLVGAAPFAPGVHEDVDVLWRWYRRGRAAAFVDAPLLEVVARPGSITRSISRAHVDGFVRAWRAVGRDLDLGTTPVAWSTLHALGAEAVLATRVRAIDALAPDHTTATELLLHLHERWTASFGPTLLVDPRPRRTRYRRIAERCLSLMGRGDRPPSERAAVLRDWLARDAARSWSCPCLQPSGALAREADAADLHRALAAGDVTWHDDCAGLAYRDWSTSGVTAPRSRTAPPARRGPATAASAGAAPA